MELVIGGYAQGKLAHVLAKYPGAVILDEKEDKKADVLVWNAFHRSVRELLAEGMDREAILALAEEKERGCNLLVIIADEIGGGIVPMEVEERTWREETGRILCRIAARADRVERIVCGIPQIIK